jgi:cell division initiation protein
MIVVLLSGKLLFKLYERMKITPLEIRQKTFEKNFRGYDKDEVDGYLLSLSQEWERLLDENKEYSIKLKSSEREVEKLREVENSLFKTLKTAEDTGANIMDQASKAAELHMKETELKAEAILNDARNKAHDTIEEAEVHAKNTYSEMESQVKALAKLYQTLENLRDDLLSDIKSITHEISEKVSRAQSHIKHFDVDEQLREMRKASMKGTYDKRKDIEKAEIEEPAKLPESTPTEEKEEEKPPRKNEQVNDNRKDQDGGGKSFFDEIE